MNVGGFGNAYSDYHGNHIDSLSKLNMKNTVKRFLFTILFFAALASLLSACSIFKVGEIGAVKEANALAITCKADGALVTMDRAVQGGSLASSIGGLQRVVILRDAVRTAEVNAAMAERNKR